VIHRVLAAGLVDHWKQKTWVHMKEDSKEDPPKFHERKLTEPLRTDDLQGVFYLSWLLLGIALLVIVLEMIGGMRHFAWSKKYTDRLQ
jgi:hypothetical protein